MPTQEFWSVESAEGEPDLWVCMSCMSEVFPGKVPIPNCPICHEVSSYEAFTLESIRDWGTEDLIAKAEASVSVLPSPAAQPSPVSGMEPPE